MNFYPCYYRTYKYRKEEENSPSLLKFIQISFNQTLIVSNGAA